MRRLCRDEMFVRFVVERAGLRYEHDVEQTLRGVTVKLWHAAEDQVLVVCGGWPRSKNPDEHTPAPKSLSMPELFAIAETGRVRTLESPSVKRWVARALVEAQLLAEPPPLALALLADPTEAAAITWRLITQELTLRQITDPPGTPIPISTPHLAEKYHVTERILRSGKLWLRKRGYIVLVDEVHVGKQKPLGLWAVVGAPGHDVLLSAGVRHAA